jgi:ribonuclease HII
VPDFSLEHECAQAGLVIGLDEAGRGPWAGPVVAAAAWLDPARTPQALLHGLDDSKALSARAREALFLALYAAQQDGVAEFAIAEASVAEIDEINILQASLLAMRRAAARISDSLRMPPTTALVDGNKAPDLACTVRTVIKGDSRSLSIAAASILAKVTRDRAMSELAARHPGYGWERNMGYGTAEHRRGLDTLGVTAHHRRSFRPIRERLIA